MSEIDEVRVAADTDGTLDLPRARPEPAGPAATPGGPLRRHLADPFSRNAYALMVNTALTGLLGLVFWLLAARLYPDPDVGRGSALVSTLTLLSGIVALNVTGTLSRFIPGSGARTRAMVLYAYGLSSLAVVVLTGGFLLTLDLWGPTFDLLRDPAVALWFVAAVIAAGLFTVQDGVLVALRGSAWVPVENGIFGIAKIVLLVLLAAGYPRDGIYLSWVIPMALLVVPVSALIFGRLVPRHGRTYTGFLPPTSAQVGRFFAGDYVGAVFAFATVSLVPVMVATTVEPFTFAYFYVAWMIGGLLVLIPVNLAHSLTVEGVYETDRLVHNCRAALRRATVLLLLAAVVVALAAPHVLGSFGRGYLDAVPLLQIVALAALPRAVVEIWIGVLRAQGRSHEIARLQVAMGTVTIAAVLAWLQLDRVGQLLGIPTITGVGLVALAGQAVVALAVLPRLRRFIAEPAVSTPDAVAPAPERVSTGGRAGGVPRHGVAARVRGARQHVRPGRGPWQWQPGVGVCLLTALAVAAFLVPLAGVDLGRIDGYGLVSVIPPVSMVGLATLTVAFFVTLSLRRPLPAVLGAQLLIMVVCLHGLTAVLEPLPRFPTAWLHLGFVEFIDRAGTTLPELDGRWSWPGFFALTAFLTGGGDVRALTPLLTATPLVLNLLYLVPLALLLRNVRASWAAKWFAAWLFVILNWVGQDYFSPQGFTFWLYLMFIAILVTWFRAAGTEPDEGRAGVSARWRPAARAKRCGELPPRPAEPGLLTALLLLLVGLAALAVVSHQLTPFFMLVAGAGLVLARRCTARGLPALLAVMLVAWVSYLAAPYWSGHFQTLLASIGDVSANVSTSVAGRLGGSGQQHQVVVFVRIALAAAVIGLAVLGALRRRRRGITDRVLVVLLVAPFVAVGLQSYGGEIGLRVYLFALPAACVLAAFAVFPSVRSGMPLRRRFVAACACALVLVGAFLVARFGNERYELVRAGELAAVQAVYQQEGRIRILFTADASSADATPFMPIGFQDLERVSSEGVAAPRDPDDISGLVERMRELGDGAYLISTRGQEAYVEVAVGYPPGWGDRFRARLATAPEFTLFASNDDAVVYTVAGAGVAAPPPPAVTGIVVGATPSTVVGSVFLVLLLGILLRREVLRLRLPAGRHRTLRPLTYAAVPLLIGLVAVVLERLLLLA